MPELPEVETIKRQLSKVKGKTIKVVEVISGRKINVPAKEFVKIVKGAKVKNIGRRAKLLLIHFDRGWTAVIHLKMTGRMILGQTSAKASPYTFVVFTLSGGKKLFWDDIRKFGFLKMVKTEKLPEFLESQGFGPEPLQKDFSAEKLKACLQKYGRKKIKPLLMEQRCIAGLGNIYAAEILAYAGVHPLRLAGTLSKKEVKDIHKGLKEILSSAIAKRGTSADAYVDLYGRTGEFVPMLKVYGREGERCAYCRQGVIKKIVLGGRGTYFCSRHQK